MRFRGGAMYGLGRSWDHTELGYFFFNTLKKKNFKLRWVVDYAKKKNKKKKKN